MENNLVIWENPAFLTRVDEWVLSGRPKQNSIDWICAPWIKEFPEYEEFLSGLHTRRLGFLNRETVKQTVQDESENGKHVEAFLVVMIWGYASDSRGPARTKKILSQPNAEHSLAAAYVALLNDDLTAAYLALVETGPKYLGPAFATKFLYFASQSNIEPCPLILDSQVAEGLLRWGNTRYNSLSLSAQDYLGYLKYMSVAAEVLGLTPEDLEFLIFSENAKLKGNQSWANRPSEVRVSRTEIRAWAYLFCAEILLRNPNLVAYYSQPGGGQYDCISIREIEKQTGFEADLNISGSIHFFEPVVNHFSWESLISRGVSGTCEMLAKTYGWEHTVQLDNSSNWAKSLRSMAEFAVQTSSDMDIQYQCLVVDNSAYGLSVDNRVFDLFPEAKEALESCPKLLILPKETWFWKITNQEEVTGLIDTFNGVYYYNAQETQDLDWPN